MSFCYMLLYVTLHVTHVTCNMLYVIICNLRCYILVKVTSVFCFSDHCRSKYSYTWDVFYIWKSISKITFQEGNCWVLRICSVILSDIAKLPSISIVWFNKSPETHDSLHTTSVVCFECPLGSMVKKVPYNVLIGSLLLWAKLTAFVMFKGQLYF